MRAGFAFLMIPVMIALASPSAEAQSANAKAPVKQSAFTGSRRPHRVKAGSDGLNLSTADGAYTLHIHGYLQADNRMFASNLHGEPLDTFLFRRIRPLFEGTIFQHFDYRFMPDFGQDNPQIQEAYLEWKSLPAAKLRVGKFKEPIGLEILQQDRESLFPERSMASDLLPLRYMGAQVGGSAASGQWEYAAGYFNGSNDGSNGGFEWVQANEIAARLFLHPFAAASLRAVHGFGVGFAGSDGHQHGPVPGLKTVAQSTFFKYASTTIANGLHSRIAPQASYNTGRVGIQTEYVISLQDVRNQTYGAAVRNVAWQLSGSVLITGAKNSPGSANPRNPFDPRRGLRHIGALELTARHSHVTIDPAAFPMLASPVASAQKAAELGVGMNWLLNRYVKLTTAYEWTRFKMADGDLAVLPTEKVLMSRVQLAF